MSGEGRDYIFFLEDILAAAAKIEKFTEGLSFEEFRNYEMAVDAVLRNLEVIGEAVKNIPDDLKNRHQEVEWKEAVGFRNVLAHDYFGIDLESVWDTLKKNIPVFKEHIIKVLKLEISEDKKDEKK